MRELFDGKYSVTDDGKLFSNRSNKFFFDSLKEACVAFSLNESKASSVANGHRKSTGGCKVCYMNLH